MAKTNTTYNASDTVTVDEETAEWMAEANNWADTAAARLEDIRVAKIQQCLFKLGAKDCLLGNNDTTLLESSDAYFEGHNSGVTFMRNLKNEAINRFPIPEDQEKVKRITEALLKNQEERDRDLKRREAATANFEGGGKFAKALNMYYKAFERFVLWHSVFVSEKDIQPFTTDAATTNEAINAFLAVREEHWLREHPRPDEVKLIQAWFIQKLNTLYPEYQFSIDGKEVSTEEAMRLNIYTWNIKLRLTYDEAINEALNKEKGEKNAWR